MLKGISSRVTCVKFFDKTRPGHVDTKINNAFTIKGDFFITVYFFGLSGMKHK